MVFRPEFSLKLYESAVNLIFSGIVKVPGSGGTTLNSTMWVCLGIWGAINCFIAIRLGRRPGPAESRQPLFPNGSTTTG